MNKKILALALTATVLLSSFSLVPYGVVYADVTIPVESTGTAGNRTGKSESLTWLGMVSLGDSSLKKANPNASISKVSTQDTHIKNILGIYIKYMTIVTGN